MALIKMRNSRGEIVGTINEDTGEEQLSEQLKPKKVNDEGRTDPGTRTDSTATD